MNTSWCILAQHIKNRKLAEGIVALKTYIIACAVLAVDMKSHAQSQGIDFEYKFLEAGLHNNPKRLKEKLQAAIDEISRKQDGDRIIIGYGVCGKGTIGIQSRQIPLVIPKVHDCIALFLGGDSAYKAQFEQFPGTYYLSAGWCEEHTEPLSQRRRQVWMGPEKVEYDDLLNAYGKKTADTTFKFFNAWQNNYQRAAFIETDIKSSSKYDAQAREMAEIYGWEYEKIPGSHALIAKLMTADHTDDQVLFVPPDHIIGFDAITDTLSARPLWKQGSVAPKDKTVTVMAGNVPEQVSDVQLGLGIDAGGTYTDAVIYDLKNEATLCKAKSLTTKWDFTLGISQALAQLNPNLLEQVALTALSTTLATNAIVEMEGQKVGMIIMPPAGMGKTISYEPKAVVSGVLDISGKEKTPVDQEQVTAIARKMVDTQGVTAFAVSGYAGAINPAHELAVKAAIQAETGCFVSCGHELSDRLNFKTRAMTAMLNARIIPRLASLLHDLETVLKALDIHTPIVVVKGDGTLMSADMAKERPVETILSGPAASVAGARHLTGIKDAIVVDMGGTTTDTAVLKKNQVQLNESGSHVGGHRTHVKALDIRTTGLGGDSLISFAKGEFTIGPKRVAPISWLGSTFPKVRRTMDYMGNHLSRYATSTQKMQILLYTGSVKDLTLTPLEKKIVDSLTARPMAIDELADAVGALSERSLPLERLEENFIVQRCGLTPTDLMHMAGQFQQWDTELAHEYTDFLAYLAGKHVDELICELMDKVVRRLSMALLKRQLDEETDSDAMDTCPACQALMANLMAGGNDQYQVCFKFKQPVIGIGAPIRYFLPQAVTPFGGEAVMPEDADVANAIGAVTSKVMIRRQLSIIPGSGGFTIEGISGNQRFKDFEKADAFAKEELTRMIRDLGHKAGTSCTRVALETHDRIPKTTAGDPVFMGRVIQGTLTGRPDRLKNI
ncbi:MAG: hydantoinase/oxoprolinase [Desulfobacterales bacterium]|nr:MAG: hydantoinase/oxoprolinase [Desulfobacterales bacterium]